MRRETLVGLALALTSLAAASGANAWPYYHHHHHHDVVIVQPVPVTPSVTVVQPQADPMGNPAVFAENVQRRLDRLGWQFRHEQESGGLEATVMSEFNERARGVREMLSQASADGYVAPEERHQINEILDDLQANIDDVRIHNRAIGGGPGVRGPNPADYPGAVHVQVE